VDYVYPRLDPVTHTLKVRLRFANPYKSLKPNMYADVRISAPPEKQVLVIPREALIRTGAGDRGIVALGDGRYQARKVTVGIESGDKIVIVTGLTETDKVVTSAQFLIDSESNIKAGFKRMDDHRSH